MRVLLIDDSKTMRTIQKTVLAQMGHTDVHEASDGQEVLSKVGTIKPDLVLLDCNMPNMDGLTFVKMFRQMDKTTPMIMVTTETEKTRVMDAIRAGINNYVVKPFPPELLCRRINETLARLKKAA
jgi:two-component system, chemotaxis family, chemotaxis protein CheY